MGTTTGYVYIENVLPSGSTSSNCVVVMYGGNQIYRVRVTTGLSTDLTQILEVPFVYDPQIGSTILVINTYDNAWCHFDQTPLPTATPTNTPTNTPTPSITPTISITPTKTVTPSITPTLSVPAFNCSYLRLKNTTSTATNVTFTYGPCYGSAISTVVSPFFYSYVCAQTYVPHPDIVVEFMDTCSPLRDLYNPYEEVYINELTAGEKTVNVDVGTTSGVLSIETFRFGFGPNENPSSSGYFRFEVWYGNTKLIVVPTLTVFTGTDRQEKAYNSPVMLVNYVYDSNKGSVLTIRAYPRSF